MGRSCGVEFKNKMGNKGVVVLLNNEFYGFTSRIRVTIYAVVSYDPNEMVKKKIRSEVTEEGF